MELKKGEVIETIRGAVECALEIAGTFARTPQVLVVTAGNVRILPADQVPDQAVARVKIMSLDQAVDAGYASVVGGLYEAAYPGASDDYRQEIADAVVEQILDAAIAAR